MKFRISQLSSKFLFYDEHNEPYFPVRRKEHRNKNGNLGPTASAEFLATTESRLVR